MWVRKNNVCTNVKRYVFLIVDSDFMLPSIDFKRQLLVDFNGREQCKDRNVDPTGTINISTNVLSNRIKKINNKILSRIL